MNDNTECFSTDSIMGKVEKDYDYNSKTSTNSIVSQKDYTVLHNGNEQEKCKRLSEIVRQELLSMGYIGLCSPGNDECFVIQLDMHNIRMSMYVFVYDGDNKIHLKLILPCVAERYTAPIIGLYLALANKDKALSHLHFDLYNGVLSFEYTYFAHPGFFNSDYFQKSFRSITSEAHLNYTRLNHMCSGFLNTKDKQACIALFKSSIEKLNSKTIQDHTEYGEKLSSLFSQIKD